MLSREPDDEASILREIQAINNELESLYGSIYEISMKRKFLNHRLADLKYKLSHLSNGNDNGL